MKKDVFRIVVLFSLVAMSSCKSTVSEKSPEGPGKSRGTDSSVDSQREYEERLSRLNRSLAKIRRHTELVKDAMPEHYSDNSFLDKLSEGVAKVQANILHIRRQKTITTGEFLWKTNILEPRCQKFAYTLEVGTQLEHLKYSLSSCYTAPDSLEVVHVEMGQSYVDIEYDNESLKRLLPPGEILPRIKGCKYIEGAVESLECQNVLVGKSKGMNITADISAQDDATIRIYGHNRKNGELVFQALIEKRDGQITTDIEIKGDEE